ncbi:MAG: hypothetical protein OXI35_09105 [Gemmatimonadota bacterium]|nr:hypothetical protein [Gemmatimonadota bacterium]
MSKYEESRRMLAQNPKILEALEKIKKQREERFSPHLKGKTRGKKRFSLEFSLKNITEDLEKST